MRGRVLVSLLTSALLLLAQLHIAGLRECSMCGAACRCAGHGSSAPCSMRSVGCGGGDAGSTIGADVSPRAVLAIAPECAPPFALDRASSLESTIPPSPARPPLDRPPRVSC